jgi:hypothetical protein
MREGVLAWVQVQFKSGKQGSRGGPASQSDDYILLPPELWETEPSLREVKACLLRTTHSRSFAN